MKCYINKYGARNFLVFHPFHLCSLSWRSPASSIHLCVILDLPSQSRRRRRRKSCQKTSWKWNDEKNDTKSEVGNFSEIGNFDQFHSFCFVCVCFACFSALSEETLNRFIRSFAPEWINSNLANKLCMDPLWIHTNNVSHVRKPFKRWLILFVSTISQFKRLNTSLWTGLLFSVEPLDWADFRLLSLRTENLGGVASVSLLLSSLTLLSCYIALSLCLSCVPFLRPKFPSLHFIFLRINYSLLLEFMIFQVAHTSWCVPFEATHHSTD